MKTNSCKKTDLSVKNEYPTTDWLNRNHDLLQAVKLEKINPVKIRVDMLWTLFLSGLNQPILVGATS
jgi:hypothetical protein